MNKTQFKNHFGKFFSQIENAQIDSIATNKIDTIQINYCKNSRKASLLIQSNIQMCEEGILNFCFLLNKMESDKTLESTYESIKTINEINLFEAKDAFCKEQALEFRYNENEYMYILIYTDMVESSLEFFDEKLTADKFKKVAF